MRKWKKPDVIRQDTIHTDTGIGENKQGEREQGHVNSNYHTNIYVIAMKIEQLPLLIFFEEQPAIRNQYCNPELIT